MFFIKNSISEYKLILHFEYLNICRYSLSKAYQIPIKSKNINK